MPVTEEQRRRIQGMPQDQMLLGLAFLGISEGLFSRLDQGKTVRELASEAGLDEGYVRRWADAAFAFGLLDLSEERFSL
ncbi:MAG: class I SAM-dependent methyltransferase, partial [Bacteroidota bacterium]